MNVSRINLNLLRVFAMIAQERSITVAGDRLGMSQSAVSHALAQLRQIFGDELFVRTPSGMMPTPLAADIGERLPKALFDLETAIAPRIFDPAEATRKFTIACGDYTTYAFLPKVLATFEAMAPRARMSVLPLGRRLVEQLDTGKLDLVIAGVRSVPERMEYDRLFFERTIWVMRRGHPAANVESIEDWPEEIKSVGVDYGFGFDEADQQVFANWEGLSQWTRTISDEAGAPKKSHFATKIVVPNFFAAVALMTQADFAAQIPIRLARALAPRYDLVLKDWPSTSEGHLCQIWHRAHGNKPAIRWLRQIVREVAATYQDED